LDRTIERLLDLGAVILSLNVKGATYTLNVILPPGEPELQQARDVPVRKAIRVGTL
jgi:hypothetical protein